MKFPVIKIRTIVIAVLAITGMTYTFRMFDKQPTDNETQDATSLNIILMICSSALSWVISDFYASQQNNERIDAVGERSGEKILNQSKQLWEIEQSLLQQAEKVEDEFSEQALVSAQEKIQLIRSANNTFIGDWEGVVSDNVQTKMAERNNELNILLQNASSNDADVTSSQQHSSLSSQTSLPLHLTPIPPIATNSTKLTTVLEQVVNTNTEKKSQGKMKIRLNRDTFKLNFTGKLYPPLEVIPVDLRARLVEKPTDSPEAISIHVATGTKTDFHIHAKSTEYDVKLPMGEYVFAYIVQTEDPNAHQFDIDGTTDG